MCFFLLLRGVLRHFFLHRHMNIRRGRLNFGTKMAMDIIYTPPKINKEREEENVDI